MKCNNYLYYCNKEKQLKDKIMKVDKINKVIAEIKEQTGIDLIASENNNKRNFFSVDIPTRVSEWVEYYRLDRYASQYKTIRIEPNGVNKIAIYPL